MNAVSTWQKSSYCGEGDACIHVASTAQGAVALRESADPSGSILTTTAGDFRELLRALRVGSDSAPGFELSYGPGDQVRLRAAGDGDAVVTTSRARWDAFVKGAVAGEFDHFAEERASGARASA
ncbi:DUF397 domain-containing protein [Streptomyces sp. NPDC006307]|uniref:DUF397 domain-containing protein n=1 Tax=Streptomyces sp. NPDC006307 TaxID=3156748 RepID=UPI0033B57264